MRNINLDREWTFDTGAAGGFRNGPSETAKTVNLPHDYMIETDTFPEAVSGSSSGYYNAGVAHYEKRVWIPSEWEGETVYLRFDGVMMNATVEVNGGKAALQHYGYAPFTVDLTPYIYYGQENRILITTNPSMQPNSRWYSGAGMFRQVELVHVPKLHIACDGIFASTRSLEDGQATVAVQVDVANSTLENRIAEVRVSLLEDETQPVVTRTARIQVNPGVTETAYLVLTVDNPKLWDDKTPNLYKVRAEVRDTGEFRTHLIPTEEGSVDADEVLFGIREIKADVTHGLRINGRSVKLKGGCLHHDNGLLGAVSLYDAEYRKLSILKSIGFNAVRTTHNPPSAVFLEACDRLGIYVFDEAFDAWGIAKQPGDYNQFFETDWKKDLEAFIRRDRSHPSVIIWSTGNEIPERGGLNNGYTLATRLAEAVRSLDPTRPISNAICSYWSGLDDERQEEAMRNLQNAMQQNADNKDEDDFSWETYSECFTNGLDIVGYNYMEDKYIRDHTMYPERIILGSENFPNEIGLHWPMIEEHPYMIGDFTWTAYDYIGEAGIGKTAYLDPDDPKLKLGPWALSSHVSAFPWRLANDADVDICGNILPQGVYRNIVWGSDRTAVFSYDPAVFGKHELISKWGFIDVRKSWNWKEQEGKPVQVVVFSRAEEVELFVCGQSQGRKKAGEALAAGMPLTFAFDTVYQPGEVTAVSFTNGEEVSRDRLVTTGAPEALRLTAEKAEIPADGHSLTYVHAEVVDSEGRLVPDVEILAEASLSGEGLQLAGFGSGNPITEENYTRGRFTTYRGRLTAVLKAGYEAGEATLTLSASGFAPASLQIRTK